MIFISYCVNSMHAQRWLALGCLGALISTLTVLLLASSVLPKVLHDHAWGLEGICAKWL